MEGELSATEEININADLSTSTPLNSNFVNNQLFVSSSSSYPIGTVSPFDPLAAIRRGPGRPRKDGSGPFLRNTSPSIGVRSSGYRLSLSSGRPHSQLVAAARGRFVQASSLKLCSSSTSSPSADSSSPGPGTPIYSEDMMESPFVASASAGACGVQNNFQRCAFCYLTESSLLAQGDLLHLDPTPGFNGYNQILPKRSPPPSLAPVEESVPIPGDSNLTLRINLKHSRVVRARKKIDSNFVVDEDEIFDEMENIGLPDEVEPTDIFEKTGQFYAHHCCVAWSDNMVQSESGEFENVDEAVLKSLSERCAGCGRYGASISCRVEECPKKFHYPCASAFGGFQDVKTLAMFCSDHLDQVSIGNMDAQCAKCEQVKDIQELLFCTSCGQHYHSFCLDPAVDSSASVRAGWQCPDCKSCQRCKNANDDSKMLVCDVCDKGYHTYCVQPMLTTVPKHGWKCKNCRRCMDCRSRTPGSGPSSRWHLNYTVCDSCYQQRNKGLACPLCRKAYRHCKLKNMRECGKCRKRVHKDCDPTPVDSSIYICRCCRENPMSSSSDPNLAAAAAYSNQSSSIYSADENEEELLASILKNEIGADSLSGTESPLSDLDFPIDVGNDGAFNCLDWNTLGIENDVSPLFAAEAAELPVVLSTTPKNSGQQRKRFSAYKRSRSNGAGGNRGKVERRRNSKSRGGAAASRNSAVQALTAMLNNQNSIGKHKDDKEYIHTIVVASSTDDFVFCQDMCVICGSLGDGVEGHLIPCLQCGQCYHTYCAGVKLNSVIVRRGWRCLDCTVCEGCGRGDDEQHLLLCDECDISTHTYCLDPPLDSIPPGAWRCNWCARCLICEEPLTAAAGGSEHVMDAGGKVCGSCSSLSCCSLCRSNYREMDLIIKCDKCKRWAHGKCNRLPNEEAVEKAMSDGPFLCLLCRPELAAAFGMDVARNSMEGIEKIDASHNVDGVALTKSGVGVVRWRPKLPAPPRSVSGASTSTQCIDDVIDSVTALVKRSIVDEPSWEDHYDVNVGESLDGRISVDGGAPGNLDNAPAESGQVSPSGGDKQKKNNRTRKSCKIGVGGFLVRPNRQRSLTEKSASFQNEEFVGGADDEAEHAGGVEDALEKHAARKRKRQRRKGHLDDNYPQYIQEAFFGSAPSSGDTFVSTPTVDAQAPVLLQEQPQAAYRTSTLLDSSEISLDVMKNLEKKNAMSIVTCRPSTSVGLHSEPLNEGFDDIGEDQDIFPDHLQTANDFSNILDMLMKEDMDGASHDGSNKARQSPDDKNLENLIDANPFVGIVGGIDSVEMDRLMDNMLTTELRGGGGVVAPPLPQSHVVQHMFNPQPPPQYLARPPEVLLQQQAATSQFVTQQRNNNLINAPMMIDFQQDSSAAAFYVAPPPADQHLAAATSGVVLQQQQPPVVQTQSSVDLNTKRESPPSGGDLKSNMERWEQDEPLGDQATTAAVLYANLHHADLKTKYPAWSERSKQIAKLWRMLSPEQRQNFVLLARENRTASRQVAKGKKIVSTSKSISVDMSRTSADPLKTPMTPSSAFLGDFAQTSYPCTPSDYLDVKDTGNVFFPSTPAPQQPPWTRNDQQPALLLDDLVELERREQFSHQPSAASQQQQQAQMRPQQPQMVRWPSTPQTPQELQSPGGFGQPPLQQPRFGGQQAPPPPDMLMNDLYKNQQDLDNQRKLLEGHLNQLRRNKKNSASKQRQMRKNNVEPPEHDQQYLARLSKEISDGQKQLEQVKKHVKANSSQMQEYQQKHGLAPPPAAFDQQQPQQLPPGVVIEYEQPQPHQKPPAPFGQPPQPPRMAAPYRVFPGETNPFSDTFDVREARFLQAQQQQQQVKSGMFHESTAQPQQPQGVYQFAAPVAPHQPPQQGATVVSLPPSYDNAPMASSEMPGYGRTFSASDVLVADEIETKKKKKKYRKKKTLNDGDGTSTNFAGAFGGQGQIGESSKFAPFLNIPAPKPSTLSMSFATSHRIDPQTSSSVVVNLEESLNIGFKPARSSMDGGTFVKTEQPTSRLDELESSSDPDVFNVVSSLIDRVSFSIDGDENHLLKTLLELSPTSRGADGEEEKKHVSTVSGGKGGGNKRTSSALASPTKTKRQRKNVKQKPATDVVTNDDYTLFLDQLVAQLKQAQPLGVHEPLSKPDPLMGALSGVSVLTDKASKPIIVGSRVGAYKLTFMPDFYNETFGTPPKVQNVISSSPIAALRPPAVRAPVRPPSAAAHLAGSVDLAENRSESPLELIYGNGNEPEEEVLPTYPSLKPNIATDGRLSPNFRLMAHVPMRSTPPDPPFGALIERAPARNVWKEAPRSMSDSIGVTLTLDVDGGKNVEQVLRGLAMLLNIEMPRNYEIHIDTPPHTPEKTSKDFGDSNQQTQLFCRQCETVVQQASVRKKFAELGLTPKDEDNDEATFCSEHCFREFAVNARADADPSKEFEYANGGKESPPHDVLSKRPSINNGPTMPDDGRLDEIIRTVVGGSLPYGGMTREESFHVKDLSKLTNANAMDTETPKVAVLVAERRWKGTKWLNWNSSMRAKVIFQLSKNVEQFWLELSSMLFTPEVFPKDLRICDLCSSTGDAPTKSSGRLLNYDAARWVHVSCALWSAEVYETMDGGLVNVDQAVRRGTLTKCARCTRIGATLRCYKLRCDANFHFQCALECQCCFMKDKTMFCAEHAPCTGENVLNDLSVLRKIYVDRDENRLLAKLYQQTTGSDKLALRVGSLIFMNIGQLLPHQLRHFSNKDFVFPIGYETSRIYWSSSNVRRRNVYKCRVDEVDGSPEFVLNYSDRNFADDVSLRNATASGVWSSVVKRIEETRVDAKLLKLFPQYLSGEILFGFAEPCVQKMIESLPGVDTLISYEFKFGRQPLMDLPLAVNPSGCARCEPRFRTYIKRPHTLNAAQQHSIHSLLALSGISLDSPTSYGLSGKAASLQSKWSQYRKMKSDWKNTCYLARSKIQGLGLYAKRDIEMNAMIIEYIGEIIRNEVADRREKLYQQQSRGIYMFRIDHERVIDATVTGGPARYVNHSCDPNCVAELFEFGGEAKIIIVSCRPISNGEELTYDYQFDFEDDINKIPCLCGAPHCRKWMN